MGTDWQFFIRLHDINETLYKSLHTLDLEQFDKAVVLDATVMPSAALLNLSQSIFEQHIPSTASFCILVDFYELAAQEVQRTFEVFTSYVLPLFPNTTLLTFGPPHLVKTAADQIINIQIPHNSFTEYQKKLARHLQLRHEAQVIKPPKIPFAQTHIKLTYSELSSFNPPLNESFLLTVDYDGVPYEMYCNFKYKRYNDKLVVFGQDALARNLVTLPLFYRWSWLDEVNASGIVLNDPTLYLYEHLNAGWFVGNLTRDYAKECADVIQQLVERVGFQERVNFFGASAGGFSVLAIASHFRQAKAIIDVPQINLFTYHVPITVKQLADQCFSSETIAEIPEEYHYRFDIVKRFYKTGNLPSIIYCHNINDIGHEPQLNYLMLHWVELQKALAQGNERYFALLTYQRWNLSKEHGHVPMGKSNMLQRINDFIG